MRIILFTLKRLAFLVPTLLGIVIVVFIVSHVIPADPAALVAGPFADQAQIAAIRHEYGLDRPLYLQFCRYLVQLIQGDLGDSLVTRRPVAWEIKARFPATVELALVSLLWSIVMGIPIGIYSALKRNQWLDHWIRGVTIAGLAMATFWLGIMAQLLFGYWLDLLPIAGRITGNPPVTITGLYLVDAILTRHGSAFLSSLKHILLPAATLTFTAFATLVRFTRAGVLTALNSDYVRYEQSMGLPRFQLICKYVLRNSLAATVSQVGLLFGALFAGSVVIERVFSWPGLGSFTVNSIILMDYNAVLAVALWSGVAYTLGNLLVDIMLVAIDPREIAR